MKRTLATILISLLLAPTLACAMSACPLTLASSEIEDTATPRNDAMPNCHGKTDADNKKSVVNTESSNATSLPMLVSDCLGIDLYHQPAQLLDIDAEQSDDLQHDAITATYISPISFEQFHKTLRPPLPQSSFLSYQNIYLTTHRIRI